MFKKESGAAERMGSSMAIGKRHSLHQELEVEYAEQTFGISKSLVLQAPKISHPLKAMQPTTNSVAMKCVNNIAILWGWEAEQSGCPYWRLIFIKPSFVSLIPWKFSLLPVPLLVL